MKWVLNLFPRTFLIALSRKIRPLLKWYFKGDRFIDPIDGSRYRKFLPYGYEKLRKHALCPGTLSLERHRLLWCYLEKETSFLTDALSVLHVAPEQIFFDIFKTYPHWKYTTTDLHSPLADVKADLCALPFESESYDLIFCNHVLEHILEDQKAMAELYRVLKKGGTLIAQVPLDEDRTTTYEDQSIVTPKERALAFGQYDHVRVYGKDYYKRLNEAGFKASGFDMLSHLSEEEIKRYVLPKEAIPIAVKL